LSPDEHGRLFSEQLGVWLGLRDGTCQGLRAAWVHLFESNGQLVPTAEEAERSARTPQKPKPPGCEKS